MRVFLIALFALIATIAQAGPKDAPFWTPDRTTVTKIEQSLVMPKGAQKPLEAYGRYYAGITQDGRRAIHGVFVLPQISDKSPGIYIVAERELPGVDDGGCGVIELFYDMAEDSLTSLQCNGNA